MDWPTLLAKYPRAILRDHTALVALAAIESLGLASEREITEKTGIEQEKLSATLFQLHLNSLIQYGEEHIRLTDRGHFLVDRFGLTDVILNDLVASFEETDSRRDSFSRILRLYRKESPALFQNSVSTLHAWWRILQLISSSAASTVPRSELRGSQRSFLLRDLRNWCSHATLATNIVEELDCSVRMLLFEPNVDAERCRLLDDECHNSSIDYLILLDDSVTTGHTIAEIKSRCHLSSLHRTFHLTQCKSEPFRWYDLWKPTERALSSERRSEVWSTALSVLSYELSHALLDTDDTRLEIGQALRRFKLKWDVAEFRPTQTADLLGHIMASRDIDALGEATNLDQDSLLRLLETLGAKCNDLIQTASKTMDGDED